MSPGTAVSVLRPRLPVPPQFNIDPAEWAVLTNAIFPNARSSESVVLAMSYCKARNLDIMKKPVNIVPVWDSRAGSDGQGGYVEQIWPSINETQATAARTGEWAGMDKPVWGPNITQTFNGRRKDKKKGWIDVTVTLTFPEYCEVTVYRMVEGQRCPFTEPVFWLEAYGHAGGGELPNDMWAKRPRGQLQKVAKAASLRAAFPEEGGYDESEIEGVTITHEQPDPPKPQDNWKPPQASQAGGERDAGGDDLGSTGGDEPPPHTEAPPGPPGPQARTDASTNTETVDAATGEVVGPQVVSKGEGEDWIAWGQRFLARVITSTSEDEIKAWGDHNKASLDAMEKPEKEGGAPKVLARLQAAIGKHRMGLPEPINRLREPPTIIGAG